jgi:hypothetical protein
METHKFRVQAKYWNLGALEKLLKVNISFVVFAHPSLYSNRNCSATSSPPEWYEERFQGKPILKYHSTTVAEFIRKN